MYCYVTSFDYSIATDIPGHINDEITKWLQTVSGVEISQVIPIVDSKLGYNITLIILYKEV